MALLPEKTWVGVLGGGQLGRMMALEARRMGYRVAQWVGGPNSGPASVSDWVIEQPFDCEKTLQAFLERVDVVTVEFENIPSTLLRAVELKKPLYPQAQCIEISQHREKEKLFLRDNDIPCAPFAVIDSIDALMTANQSLPGEARVLKTAEFGYDGKGQVSIDKHTDVASVWNNFDAPRAVLEQKIDLKGELSVLVARNPTGEVVVYDPAENIHTHHILDISIVPARFDIRIQKQAQEIAVKLSEKLNYIGLLAVEFFLAADDSLMVNEIAPRPHNSGHHTQNGCYTSQFEQQLRAICDLPLGRADLKAPAVVMWNLLGDLWPKNGQPDWQFILQEPNVSLHLYGKQAALPGRKMGHINLVGEDRSELIKQSDIIAEHLGWQR